ncbi:hypothetical protein WA1_31195 [Scytonema hofmannii PCC 7110]|uniref:Uncharacterized protein n=1 Tax=Scytonema hofmannii PCC 7110 TaxID=128403 RepID=A0A139X3G5_9CYAN|nr:hypothetical protein [Scytonema hofmannii]KYC39214.1 hypothetical protein WA1_31195 [Scytonema hofmannii PCC 7110]
MVSGEDWTVPEMACNKIPKYWGSGQANKKKPGWRWQDPTNQGNGVRIDEGNPNNSHLSQQVDHVVVRRNGQVIGRNGQPIAGSIKTNPTEAHIPLNEWLQWKTWYEP